ncbi:ATP-binding protein [Dictyobacter sp. S3.2.2.5]|uniref:ATP-binding protein n=1 Tax=Dictyobacter halimunensis TaxID=3026934 RepID=A0ABQ6FTC0_9CHLR|nr:ATP-binding protein [Dictyobacter sp. S3.2.2.5]
MKVAFVGKGGSGKTTLSALFSRYLAAHALPVVAFDADINQQLGEALGMSEAEAAQVPPLGLNLERIKDYLRGSNPHIRSTALMAKTTPPGHGSRLWHPRENNPLLIHFARDVHGVTLLATGPLSEDDLGLKCYHSKVGAVELLLNHCIDGPDEYVIVDMTAGADSFASGLFTRFDLTFLVVEPTRKSVGVYHQYKGYTRDYDVALTVVGNKIEHEDDLHFLQDQIEDDLLATFSRSDYIRALEKGRMQPITQLEAHNVSALAAMQQRVMSCEQNWVRFYQQAVAFHRKNASSWLNVSMGEDVSTQVDPDFSLTTAVQQYRHQFANT